MTMRPRFAWLSCLLLLGLPLSAQAVPVDYTYTQFDATTGSGTISGTIDTTLAGGPGPLAFSAPLPAAIVKQNDPNTGFTVPGNAVGFVTQQDDGNPGGSRGVHLDFSGTVALSATSGGDTYTIDVPLVMKQGNNYSYSFSVFDNPAENDVTGNPQFAGWLGDNGGGHRHTDGNRTFVAGPDTHTVSASGGLGGNANGDNLGITAGMRDTPNGPVFVDDLTFGGKLDADGSTLRVNGVPLPPQKTKYAAPPGGWSYMFEGDAAASPGGAALDGTWDHDNGSDEWDGTGPGSGRPGGARALREGSDIFLRIQDTGDPRDHGMGDPGSNRKIAFTCDIRSLLPQGWEVLDDGVTLSFRARVATTPPLDDVHPDGGGAIVPWPAGGDGYVLHDGGKGGFGIHQEEGTDQTISFALALSSDIPAHAGAGQGLVMNDLNGTSPSSDVDQQDNDGGVLNVLSVADPTAFHEFWATIRRDTSGGGTHRVDLYMDGSKAPTTFHVTAGDQDDQDYDYLGLEQGSTSQIGALDVDFVAFRPGVFAPGQTAIIASAKRGGGSTNEPPLVWPQALVEDAQAFMDRDHEYNNVPGFVVGADYVQVANDDRSVSDYTLDVTLTERADLYMFLDTRVNGGSGNNQPTRSWMFDGTTVVFQNTFTDIGIDESGDGDIDRWSRVFIAPNLPAGTYRLFEQDDGTSRNMYGVAATAAAFERPTLVSAIRSGGSDPLEPQVVFGQLAGLGEDSRAFVDRTHEWNSVPDFLLGAEYVMIANDDRSAGNFTLDLELATMADLYVMLDDRVAVRQWMLDMGFVDTLADIGVDEGGDGDIDRWSSVFKLGGLEPGTYRLFEQNQGGTNMYGVAVQFFIPEPGTLSLLTVGGIGLLIRRRRKR